jgi:hypothetical protein
LWRQNGQIGFVWGTACQERRVIRSLAELREVIGINLAEPVKHVPFTKLPRIPLGSFRARGLGSVGAMDSSHSKSAQCPIGFVSHRGFGFGRRFRRVGNASTDFSTSADSRVSLGSRASLSVLSMSNRRGNLPNSLSCPAWDSSWNSGSSRGWDCNGSNFYNCRKRRFYPCQSHFSRRWMA